MVASAHGNKLAIHRLGISHLAVGAVAQAFTNFVVVFLAPELLAGLAVKGGGKAVGSHDDDMIGGDNGHDVAGAVQVDILAVVPLPVQGTRAAVQ